MESETFTVVSWNILLDKTRTTAGIVAPQADRVPSHVQTLASLDVPLDVVCLQEVEQTPEAHHGKRIATALGYQNSHWVEHNTSKRLGEHIGMFGNMANAITDFQTPHDKRAVMTHVGSIAVVGVHNRNEKWGPKRSDQMRAVIARLAMHDRAVIVGDSNALHNGASRKLLEDAGFTDVWTQLGKHRPATFPTPEYRRIMKSPPLSLDIVYTRNVTALDAGRFKGDSDHYGIWAKLVV